MAFDLHADITARILAQIDAGVVPWRQPWSTQGAGRMPRNAISGRAYSGVNVPLLWGEALEKGYASPRWLTFKQALEAGGTVRKGEKSSLVVFVSAIERDDEDGKARRIPFLKSFHVFNVAQCDGIAVDPIDTPAPVNADARDALADAFVAATGVDLRHGEGRAYYRPADDFVMLPDFASFTSSDAYYSTLFHELTHWTGTAARLGRRLTVAPFGSPAHAAEELVAELGAAFLCAEFGFDDLDQSASYLDHYARLLRADNRAFMRAASAASKGVDYLRGLALREAPAAA